MSIGHLQAEVLTTGGTASGLPAAALVHLAGVQAALLAHDETGDPFHLDRGFTAARGLVATALPPGPVRVDELRRLAETVPAFDDLLERGARVAGAAVRRACGELWAALGVPERAPEWSAEEHEAGRLVLACACGCDPATNSERLPAGLRRVAAARVSGLLCDALADREEPWGLALGGRYDSLRHRCAPRTMLRSRGLADMVREDPRCRAAIRTRLERWIITGGRPDALAGELEAAVVHARTPARLA